MNNIIIKIAKYELHEMAYIFIDNKLVYSGNYWDFHINCHGSNIGGYELMNIWDSGIDSLASALKLKIQNKNNNVIIERIILNDKQYKELEGGRHE